MATKVGKIGDSASGVLKALKGKVPIKQLPSKGDQAALKKASGGAAASKDADVAVAADMDVVEAGGAGPSQKGPKTAAAHGPKGGGKGKKLKTEEMVDMMADLVIAHDEAIRELQSDHHYTLILSADSKLADALKVTGENYHKQVKEAGPQHGLGPPMGYMLMGLLQALAPIIDAFEDGPAEIVMKMNKSMVMDELSVIEKNLSHAFHFDGESVEGCKEEEIARQVPVLRSRSTKDGDRVLYLKLDTMDRTHFFSKVLEKAEAGSVQIKWGKGPRGAIVRKLQHQRQLQKK